MNNAFMESLYKFVLVFIDDIIIYFRDEQEHEKHICLVLQKHRENLLHVKVSKCEFWLKDVSFLGHIISAGVSIDPNKVKDVLIKDTFLFTLVCCSKSSATMP
jgi:hypothetical protein